MTIIDTPDGIAFFHLCSIRGMVRLELAGMKHSSGRSACAAAKRLYGMKGSKQSILDQLNMKIEAIHKAREAKQSTDEIR